MSGFPVVNIMMLVFSITTAIVLLYPIVRLAPSWLERSVNRRIVFHRAAAEAIGAAMARSHNDPAHLARLTEQHAFHVGALAALAPQPETPGASAEDAIDAAA